MRKYWIIEHISQYRHANKYMVNPCIYFYDGHMKNAHGRGAIWNRENLGINYNSGFSYNALRGVTKLLDGYISVCCSRDYDSFCVYFFW